METDEIKTQDEVKDSSEDRLGKIHTTLEEILQQLKQQNRKVYHHDFSYMRLIGAIAQLLVIALVFWSVVGLVDLGDISAAEGTRIKLTGATLLQLLALTFFFLDNQEQK